MGNKVEIDEADKELNDQHKLFCEEYIINFNATDAAIKAGYSEKTASSQASRLLRNVNIQAYIKDLNEKRSERVQVTADDILKEYCKIAFCDVSDFYDERGLKPISELSDKAKASVSSYAIKRVKNSNGEFEDVPIMKFHDKLKALELAGKCLGIGEESNEVHTSEIKVSFV